MQQSKKRLFMILSVLLAALLLAVGLSIFIPRCKQWKKDRDFALALKEHYHAKVLDFSQENPTLSNIDVVFIGDSLTEYYNVASHYPQFHVVNRGIGGDTTYGVEKRLEVSVFALQPKAVVMLIGVNNIHAMFDNYEQILQKLQRGVPNSKIVLLSLTAMSMDWGKDNPLAIANNQRIQALAATYGFTFVDLFTPLCDPTTNELFSDCTIDGCHFNEKGYTVITQTVTPVLNNLLSD